MSDRDTKAPSYPWYPRDFMADEPVTLMSLEEEGAYRRLLDHQWLHGSIPADVASIAKICKNAPVRTMQKLWRAIAPCFVPVEGAPDRLQNRRLERVRQEREEYRAAQSEAGRRGAAKRWGQRGHGEGPGVPTPEPSMSPPDGDADGNANGDPMATPLAEAMANDSSASAMASARGTTNPPHTGTLARVVAFWPACDDEALAEQFLRVRDALPDEFRPALDGWVRTARRVAAMLATLEQHADPAGDYRFPWKVIGQALQELAASGGHFSANGLREFCRKLLLSAPTPASEPRRSGGHLTGRTDRVLTAASNFASRED